MHRLFVNEDEISGNVVTVSGDDAFHLSRSLRMRPGEEISVACNGTGYNCTIERFTEKQVIARINCKEASNEPRIRVTLYQAITKGDSFESIIRKSVECGVYRIVPFQSEFCNGKLGESNVKKLDRYRKISKEAAMQSKRNIIPEICDPVSFDDVLNEISEYDNNALCYENENDLLLGKFLNDTVNDNSTFSLIIGSEGGFSADEISKAREKGANIISLGKRILRAETAPVFALSCIICISELM